MPSTTPPYERPRAFGVYLHFPFCASRCSYCDFTTSAAKVIPHREYARAVQAELADRAHRFDGLELASVYLGGGTPSLWDPEAVEAVVGAVIERFGSEHLREVTLEANPGSRIRERLDDFARAGVSRVSVGVQSLNDATLLRISRAHTAREARSALEAALAHPGLRSVSADLIYGLPGSSVESVLADLDSVLDLGVQHVSLYALTLEEPTPMARAVAAGSLRLPDEDAVCDQAEALFDRAAARGLVHYEISNLALPGHVALHNSLYWHDRAYMALGAGAVGLEPGEGGVLVRRQNRGAAAEYVSAPTVASVDVPIERPTRLRETIMTRTRWLLGFSTQDLCAWTTKREAEAVERAVEELLEAGLLARAGSQLRLTRRGLLLHNEVVLRFFDALDP